MEFNAHRVFDPNNIVELAKCHGLILKQLTVISSGGEVREVRTTTGTLQTLAEETYNLGIFVFTKA